jgi:hypothetical protein
VLMLLVIIFRNMLVARWADGNVRRVQMQSSMTRDVVELVTL